MPYYAPTTWLRAHSARIIDWPLYWEDKHPFSDFLVNGDVTFDTTTGCPSILTLIAYKVRGLGDPTPPVWADYLGGNPPSEAFTAFGYEPPDLLGPGNAEDFFDAYQYLIGLRMLWHCGLLRAEQLVAAAFHYGTHHLETEPPDGDSTPHKAMSYGRAGKKNAGAWYRANEIVRHNPALKTMLNADSQIRTTTAAMLTVIRDIALANGYVLNSAENITTKSQAAFPVTKQFWMGYLPFSVFGPGPAFADLHRQDFGNLAKELRKRTIGLIKGFKLVTDAFNEADEANPGGQVGG